MEDELKPIIKGLVSIITPAYNASRFISQTIESVINQTYKNWEMIIIDDGSKDNTLELLDKYSKKDNRIRYFLQKNSGAAVARNNAFKEARGNYIAFLDADDTWNQNFLEKQINFLKEKNATLVCSSHTRIDELDNEILKPFIVPEKIEYKDLLKTCSISCLTALYDVTKFGKFFHIENYKSFREDYILWLEIIKKCKVIYGNKEILANYRITSSSVSRNKIKIVKWQFLVYYKIEKLGLLKSVYYIFNWAFRGFFKYKN